MGGNGNDAGGARLAAALIAFFAFMAAGAGAAETVQVPAEVRPFVEAGTRVLALERGDLDGDGAPDYILVLERPDLDERQRPLIVLKRGGDGRLQAVKRNERVVLCSRCGGIWGDPFESVAIGERGFTVTHYGGSNWRWSRVLRFGYSRIDRTWQLVEVVEESFHTSSPDKPEIKRYRPPRDYGKIDLSDFDPEGYLGKGPR